MLCRPPPFFRIGRRHNANPYVLVCLCLAMLLPAIAFAAVLATVPIGRADLKWWAQRHEQKLAELHRGPVELVWLGDSITQDWELPEFQPIWQRFYGDRHAINLGFVGDTTASVLWRIDTRGTERHFAQGDRAADRRQQHGPAALGRVGDGAGDRGDHRPDPSAPARHEGAAAQRPAKRPLGVDHGDNCWRSTACWRRVTARIRIRA